MEAVEQPAAPPVLSSLLPLERQELDHVALIARTPEAAEDLRVHSARHGEMIR